MRALGVMPILAIPPNMATPANAVATRSKFMFIIPSIHYSFLYYKGCRRLASDTM
jgi:hypothetical protein